jgi:hypothetical protein
VQSQEITVNRLASSLELALEKIAKLEQELTNPPTIQFDKNLDDKISELSSMIDEKLKPLVLQQAFTKELTTCDKLLPLPQTPVRARTDAWKNPSAQRATQLRRVLARVYDVSIQNQITTTVP